MSQELKISDLLEKGLTAFQKVLKQEVRVNKEDMVDLINFETALVNIIRAHKQMESDKSRTQILEESTAASTI